jgi:rod shape-determining protein MreB
MDEAIISYVKKTYNLLIGESTAERIKKQIGAAIVLPDAELKIMEIKGRDLIHGVPKEIILNALDIAGSLSEPISHLVEAVKSALELTPPEVSSDIFDKGIVITGGAALLHNLDYVISQATGLPVFVAENPLNSVAMGMGKILEEPHKFKHVLFTQN